GALLARAECWIERARPEPRRIDIRRYVRDVRLLDGAVEMDLLVTPNGTARPDEVLEQLGLRGVLDAGAVIERTLMELEDDYPEPAARTGAAPNSLTPGAVPPLARPSLEG